MALDMRGAFNDTCASTIDRSHRSHLGASSIGEDCSRYLWYKFHWFKRDVYVDKHGEDVSGRMLRLFQRGHREEAVLIDIMRRSGAQVWEYDESLPLKDGKSQQFRIKAVNGHFGGSLDGIIRWDKFHPDYMLLEMKTYNEKRFKTLTERGVAAADPKYAAQMIVYGADYKLAFALFIAICKNNDDIYTEIVNLKLNAPLGVNGTDPHDAAMLFDRAARIINSPTAPPKLAANATYYKCKFCTMIGVCHKGEKADVSCRSCKFAQPVENGQWKCHVQNSIIPEEAIGKAWPCHVEIS